jgi:hypothetical protein
MCAACPAIQDPQARKVPRFAFKASFYAADERASPLSVEPGVQSRRQRVAVNASARASASPPSVIVRGAGRMDVSPI